VGPGPPSAPQPRRHRAGRGRHGPGPGPRVTPRACRDPRQTAPSTAEPPRPNPTTGWRSCPLRPPHKPSGTGGSEPRLPGPANGRLPATELERSRQPRDSPGASDSPTALLKTGVNEKNGILPTTAEPTAFRAALSRTRSAARAREQATATKEMLEVCDYTRSSHLPGCTTSH